MRILVTVAAAVLVLGLGACGEDSSSGGDGTASTPDEMAIAKVIDKYELATKNHDAVMFCTEVLPNRRDPANGSDPKLCPAQFGRLMHDPGSQLSKPAKIEVEGYKFFGRRANVKVLLNGKPQVLHFSNGRNGWRLKSLG